MKITKLEKEALYHCLSLLEYDCESTSIGWFEDPECYNANVKHKKALKRIIKKVEGLNE